jgi:ATP-dependent Zn protease
VWLLFKNKSSNEYFAHSSETRTGTYTKKESSSYTTQKSVKTAVFVVLIMISSLWLFFKTKANKQESANSSSKKAKKMLEADRANGVSGKSEEELKLEAIFKD